MLSGRMGQIVSEIEKKQKTLFTICNSNEIKLKPH